MTSEHPSVSLFPLGEDGTTYRKLGDEGVGLADFEGQEILKVAPEALRSLAEAAFSDVNHLLRPGHLAQLSGILDDPEASANDRFVALDLLKNANISAAGVLPMCQDTGTAIIMGKKGRKVWTEGADEAVLGQGVLDAYRLRNLRYSQPAGAADHVRGDQHRQQPAGPDRDLRGGRGGLQVPVHR
jgi:fumarate hydratase class I